MRRNLKIVLILFVLSFISEAQPNPLARRVLILVNDSMRAEAGTGSVGASVYVGQYYAQKRGIPDANIFHVKASTEETISYDEYLSTIEKPLKAFLDANGGAMKRQILYIVPTYGIPLKATVTSDLQGALDSLIAGMYASKPDNLVLRVVSPYAAPTGSRPPRFSSWSTLREASGLWKMFIVSRLDGPGALIAKGLVDKAMSAESDLQPAGGKAYFDYQGTRTPAEGQYVFDEEIRAASVLSKSAGFTTILNTQRDALCGSTIHPAAVYYYDSTAKNVYVNAMGTDASTSFAIKPLPEGEVTVRLKNENVNNTGNFVFVTLATSDPRSYIKLTYPFVPFTGYNIGDKITLEKFVNGASAAKAEMAVDKTMDGPINSVTELKISFRNSVISVSRNGTMLAQGTDPGAMGLNVTKVAVSARCWNYRLNGFAVADTVGTLLWNDNFSSDTTKNYTWDMTPAAGLDALWAWGWYGSAYDSYRFVNGAVGAQLTSFTAITIRKPTDPDPAFTSVGTRRWGGNWVPRMLEQGVTATWGAVTEPYANFYAAGGNVFDHLWNGYNFGESFYIAQNTVNWVMTAVGDPLYAPKIFRNRSLVASTLLGVSNAASLQSGSVAPGEIVTLFGEGLGPDAGAGAQLTTDGLVGTEIGGTRVFFDDLPAPLIYASSSQVNAIVPYEIAGRSSTMVRVEASDSVSNAVVLNVAPVAPGLFTTILNEEATLNSASNPTAKGSVVVLYGTGEGQTDPPGVNGQIASGVPGKPVSPVSVQVGGLDADVLYAGGAPGQVAGLFQVNVRVPAGVDSGLVPVVLKAGGSSSQSGVMLAVQ